MTPTHEQMTTSRQDTLRHIQAVQTNMDEMIALLRARSNKHDLSKLQEPEMTGYAGLHADMRGVSYGTPEYAAVIERYRSTVEHHYNHNDHHPQHHAAGVAGMSMLMLLEMLADWKAAAEQRDTGGSLSRSLDHYEQQPACDRTIARLLRQTAEELGWV